jgi:hypothetical protein
MAETVFGIVKLVRPEQPKKAPETIVVMELGNVILVSPVQFRKS